MVDMNILDKSRIEGDPELTDDAEVYQVTEADPRNRSFPVFFRIDVTVESAVVLSRQQPGPFAPPDLGSEMFVDLETLTELGRIAEAIIVKRQGEPDE